MIAFDSRTARRWASALALVGLMAAPALAARQIQWARSADGSVAPVFSPRQQSLMYLLNGVPARHRAAGEGGGGALAALGQALVLKPDLGACQAFVHGCHEGAIVTLPDHDVLRTLGAGLGMRLGSVRFEYAYGIHTGASFIGIRSSIP